MRRAGAPAEAIEAERARLEPETVRLWKGHEEAVKVFVASGTQWRRAGMDSVPAGLDMAGVRAVCAFLRVRPSPLLLRQLASLERAALDAFAERRR